MECQVENIVCTATPKVPGERILFPYMLAMPKHAWQMILQAWAMNDWHTTAMREATCGQNACAWSGCYITAWWWNGYSFLLL